jgi:hypothetical protein
MAKKTINWKTKGMNRDTSVSAFSAEFAFENLNLRLSTNEGNTMMSWVNEKGTKKVSLQIDTTPWNDANYVSYMDGTPIGTAVLNHQLVVFTTGGNDCIYVLSPADNDTFSGKRLFKGSLNFSVDCPIETLVSYESENIQKVYWTDGKNQVRVINIAPYMDSKVKSYNSNSFDFVQELSLNETVTVQKIYGSGEFPAGVIQYAFTYYNKYAQETNIFYTTPLQYISYVDRGGAPDDKIANSFKLTINNLDSNFEYLRIYSILRTSRDATPLCKRIQDIEVSNTTVTFIDNGLQGDIVDPTELLYIGGEEITAKTMEQKDGTLFLGNVSLVKPSLKTVQDTILSLNNVTKSSPLAGNNISYASVQRNYNVTSKSPFSYINTLDTSLTNQGPSSCFKSYEYYRLGVQFQYKNGKWSEPCWIGDKQCKTIPSANESNGTINVPEFTYRMEEVFPTLYNMGYRRVRGVFMVPGSADRTIYCQGIGAPTMFRQCDRHGALYGQASWLFRTYMPESHDWNVPNSVDTSSNYNGGGYVSCAGLLKSQYDDPTFYSTDGAVASPYLSSTEVMGQYDFTTGFRVDRNLFTINSPDVEFDDLLSHLDFAKCGVKTVGYTTFGHTYGDMDIQTSTPAIGSDAAGFVHKSIHAPGYAALISGLYYNDYIVDDQDSTPKYGAYGNSKFAVDFPVYMWHKNGSLNNDVNRDNQSAKLLKKKISNYRVGGSTTYAVGGGRLLSTSDIQLFSSDQLSIVKVDGKIYQGNIDTLVTPATTCPHYFAGNPYRQIGDAVDENTSTRLYYRLNYSKDSGSHGIWSLYTKEDGTWGWNPPSGDYEHIGDFVSGLDQWREGVSIKYKSSPHLVAYSLTDQGVFASNGNGSLSVGQAPIMEIQKIYDSATLFGGTSDEALQAATWIPCGPPVSFSANTTRLTVEFKWGDSYFQRFECLKTYPFTNDDKNQVIEIASFMVETRTNIDGRYDRNRACINNLNVSPINFNLINPIYTQMDNFFSYKILPADNYETTDYPNDITWTKTKENGADVDLWTNVTMANILEMDGDKGEVTKLARLNNQLIAFQDSGISQILYNEQTQITSTEGVPIEIANSAKVQGKRYYSDTVGCSNKWSVIQTPSGIYFMDNNDKSIYLFNGQLNNLSTSGGFNSWAKQNIPAASVKWNPRDFNSFVSYYDKLNQEVLFINKDKALAFSEKFSCFTSFYDYGNTPYFNCIDDTEVWLNNSGLWKHRAGDYCTFFGAVKPFSVTLIGNQEPQVDKIFTNLEFRSCVEGEGIYSGDKFTPTLPFDTLEAWDEYQHGLLTLTNKNGKVEHGKSSGDLIRKFRIWRCDIPRDNAPVDNATESALNIKRFKVHPLDRIRNPWVYLKLTKSSDTTHKTEIHDIVATYFG